MIDYGAYKKAIKRTIEVDGFEWNISYAPSRYITTLEGYLRGGMQVAPADVLGNAKQWFVDSEHGGVECVDPTLLADRTASALIIEDFLKVLAVLTDEEMQRRVIAMAPRKKNGSVYPGRNAISISMDGLFPTGERYAVNAKSDASGGLTFSVKRKKSYVFDGFGRETAEFLEKNKDIVERLGLGSPADVKGPVNDYAGYKKNIERTVEACGIKSALTYDPTASIEALEKCLQAGVTVTRGFTAGAEESIRDAGLFGTIAPEFLADQAASVVIIEDFLKLLALLTNEEMQKRIVGMAPKKKDGNLASGRIALRIAMDGVFADGGCYAVKIKSDKSNGLAYTVIRETYPYWSFDWPSHDTAEFLEKNKDIVERLGLNSSPDVEVPASDRANRKDGAGRTVEEPRVKTDRSYDLSAGIEVLKKCLQEGRTVAPGFTKEAEMSYINSKSLCTIDPEYLADRAASAVIIEDFIKLLTLFADEEMQQRVVDMAPKKKDGNLAAGRIALSIAMDGVFADCSFYAVRAKSDKSNRFVYKVTKEVYPEWSFGRPSHDTAEFLEKNRDIVERLGLS